MVNFIKQLLSIAILIFIFSNVKAQLSNGNRSLSSYAAPEKCAVGSLAPDFVLKTTVNNDIKLSSLRNNYVLVEIWASWCKPCRAENPKIREIFLRYQTAKFDNANGFSVVAVSIDDDNKLWKDAITTDGIQDWGKMLSDTEKSQWVNVIDQKGIDGDVVKSYNVNTIPANFLIDGTGRIVAKNFRSAELPGILDEHIK